MNLPELFTERMSKKLGDEFPAFLQAMQSPPVISVRLNPDKDATVFAYSEPVPWHPHGRYLKERPSFTRDPLFHAGCYYVQESSSMFLFHALQQLVNLDSKLRVLDLCAAPGGKSTLLASAISKDSLLVANETIKSRVNPLRENMERWGSSSVIISNHDPEDFSKLQGFFDIVLIDAPCSGEGLFRKEEKAIAEWSIGNLELCAARQKRLLSSAVPALKEGGLLIYATCTFNPEENENNVRWLIQSGAFRLLNLKINSDWGILDSGFGLHFFPHRVQGEGFFIACLEKQRTSSIPKIIKGNFTKMMRLGEAKKAQVIPWLGMNPEVVLFSKPNGNVIAIPKAILEDAYIIASHLQRRSLGIELGSFKGSDFLPSHSLAMNQLVSRHLPSIAMNKEESLRFLKKEPLHFGEQAMGWKLATYNGQILGWVKVLKDRTNNYLPMDRKIRMNL